MNPTVEQIKHAYIEGFLQRRTDAVEFANFTEIRLAEFIRKYRDPSFVGVFECTDHNYYDNIRACISQDDRMMAEDEAESHQYYIHLKKYSEFLESKAFTSLFKRKLNTEGTAPDSTNKNSGSATPTQQNKPSVPKFRDETEGERKHITKEMDVVYRNPQLRQQCLDIYGYQCQCCGMDFSELYGEELGANFIEVHHLKLISSFEKDGVPENFLENLVPLCSNCHSMIHHIKDSEHTLRDLRNAFKGEKKELKVCKED